MTSLLEEGHSTRDFALRPIPAATLAALAWAAQGKTQSMRRVHPSAHALYPLALTVVAGDHRTAVARTSFVDGEWLVRAAALLLLSPDLDAANEHFADQAPKGSLGQRYVWLEVGHASQNVYLQAAELDIGAVLIGGFDDDRLSELAILPTGHDPLAVLAIGRIG